MRSLKERKYIPVRPEQWVFCRFRFPGRDFYVFLDFRSYCALLFLFYQINSKKSNICKRFLKILSIWIFVPYSFYKTPARRPEWRKASRHPGLDSESCSKTEIKILHSTSLHSIPWKNFSIRNSSFRASTNLFAHLKFAEWRRYSKIYKTIIPPLVHPIFRETPPIFAK